MVHPHNPKTDTELHYSAVRDILAKTAIQMGLGEEYARALGQSVWYLCNRGYPATTNTIVFLALNNDVLKEVWGNPNYPAANDDLSLACPIRTALIINNKIDAAQENNTLDSFEHTIGRSALAMLSLPLVSHSLKQRNCGYEAIQISGFNATITMSDAGMVEQAETLSHEFAWVGSKDDINKPVKYTLSKATSPDDGSFFPKRRCETLWLPTSRLDEDGSLRL